jgi:hypothetical protein
MYVCISHIIKDHPEAGVEGAGSVPTHLHPSGTPFPLTIYGRSRHQRLGPVPRFSDILLLRFLHYNKKSRCRPSFSLPVDHLALEPSTQFFTSGLRIAMTTLTRAKTPPSRIHQPPPAPPSPAPPTLHATHALLPHDATVPILQNIANQFMRISRSRIGWISMRRMWTN